MTQELFNEDYFMRGAELGISNFSDFRWLPEKTGAMVGSFTRYLDVKEGDTVLDFGCARGYVVKALRRIGIESYGVDISQWALENADEEIAPFLSNQIPDREFDFVLSKDCYEHIPYEVLDITIRKLLLNTRKAMFVVVPLTSEDFGEYICERDEQDVTHVVRWTLPRWLQFLQYLDPSFVVNGSYHIPGIKNASIPYPRSCGFFTLKRFQ